MSDFVVTHDYPDAPAKVWRAITDPALMALWTMKPEGYVPVAGTKFKLLWKPSMGWRGYFDCEVIGVEPLRRLDYTWDGDGKNTPLPVTYALAETAGGGSRITFTISGMKGFLQSQFIKRVFGPGMRREIEGGLTKVLADMDEDGRLRPDSQLKPLI